MLFRWTAENCRVNQPGLIDSLTLIKKLLGFNSFLKYAFFLDRWEAKVVC